MLVVLDVGNTAIKFGVFDGDRLVATERIEGGAAGGNVFPIAAIESASEVVAVSSSPVNSTGLAERLGRPVRILGDEVRRAVATTYARPGELGLDRIAAGSAACAVSPPREPRRRARTHGPAGGSARSVRGRAGERSRERR